MPATATPTAAGVSQPGAALVLGTAPGRGVPGERRVDADRHRQQREDPQRQQHRRRRIVLVMTVSAHAAS